MLKNGDNVHVMKTGRAATVLEIIGSVAKVAWISGGTSIVPVRMLEVR